MPAPSADLQLRRPDDYGFARKLVTVPLSIDEFGAAMRSFPILFAEVDGFPFGLLTLERENRFVDEGHWDGDTYVPGYVRRYPFVIGETDQAIPVIIMDHNPETLTGDGDGREMLFENGQLTPLGKAMLEDCRTFLQGAYRQTCVFAEALKSSGILTAPDERHGLPNSRTPFEIVDRAKLDGLGAALARQWSANGWLNLIDQHLASLERFGNLLSRDAQGKARS